MRDETGQVEKERAGSVGLTEWNRSEEDTEKRQKNTVVSSSDNCTEAGSMTGRYNDNSGQMRIFFCECHHSAALL